MRMMILPVVLVVSASAASVDTPTYAKEVSRIVQKNCEGCHRPGQVGPFALTNYEEVRAFAPEIKRVTQARTMPPWSAVPGHGDFKNERRLTEAQIVALAAWVDAGMPMGNKKDLPPPVKYNEDWALGKPDLIFGPSEPFELAGNGADEYRCFVVPAGLEDARYIKAMEVRPGNRKIVHHVRVFADITGQAREADAADPKPGFDCSLGMTSPYKRISIGGWAPGMTPEPLPDDIGVYFPKGSDVVMEVHYHRNGLRQSDRSSLGVYLHKHTPKNVQKSLIAANLGIRIPAGMARHEEKARITVNRDVLATSITPHMHLLGVEMRVVATFPDGRIQDLVWAKPYDFSWQTTYRFREPVALPKGTRIDVTAYYDNSESNPKNPNKPLKEVRWGEGTTEEMLVAFIGVIDAPAATAPQSN
ncbi:MAG: hypothetical protein JNL98_10485 [Bryobacterales bacterium]|nr:hypothetical protein [Bryobacterales bacterium]